MKKKVIRAIEWYQRTLSPDTGHMNKFFPGGYCKYTPNCSEYSKQSIEKHGLFVGILRSFWRIIRCNPWSKGGYDPV